MRTALEWQTNFHCTAVPGVSLASRCCTNDVHVPVLLLIMPQLCRLHGVTAYTQVQWQTLCAEAQARQGQYVHDQQAYT